MTKETPTLKPTPAIDENAVLSGYGCAPGTCGELVQGRFASGQDFLVALPVQLFSTAQARITPDCSEILITPNTKSKTAKAVRRLLDQLLLPAYGARIQVDSQVPEGKGMASSTADITAACRAIGNALGIPTPPELISAIARQIEPSDGVMYPGLVCYDHVHCELIEHLGEIPPGSILVVDLGGVVDTLAFNRKPKTFSAGDIEACQRSYAMLQEGIIRQDLALIGQAATLSARTNQKFLYKPALETLIRIGEEYGAHGVCIGHSGTVVSLIFGEAGQPLETAKTRIKETFQRSAELHAAMSLSGSGG